MWGIYSMVGRELGAIFTLWNVMGVIIEKSLQESGEIVVDGTWSPDGKWLVYGVSRFVVDSLVDVYLLDVSGNNQPKKIARFSNIDLNDYNEDLIWIDSLNLSISTRDKFYTYSLSKNKMVEDSVLYYPINGRI